MVLPALESLKNLIKTKSYHIDLPFFRLHYRATVCLLLTFCLILTAKVLFGETIKCHGWMGVNDDHKFYDNLCYAVGTYTSYVISLNKTSFDQTNVTFTVHPESRYLYSGIFLTGKGKGIRIFWHNYYQYVPLVLFVQAVLFYFPHYLWKLWENGIISSICQRLHVNRFAPNEYLDSNYDIIYYIQNSLKLNTSLVYKYYFCHVLCMVNLVAQIVALDTIFNYQFISYGYVVVKYLFFDDDVYGIRAALPRLEGVQVRNLNNPMDFTFPKVTKCHIDVSSASGKEANQLLSMCVLPLNILHDKFFLLLWFWFLILVVLTAIQIINDLMFTMLPSFRRYIFNKRFGSSLYEVTVDDFCARRSSSLQELFLLNLVGHNTDRFSFTALLRRLNKDEDWTASPTENRGVV